MEKKYYSNIFVKLAIIIFVVAALISVMQMMMKYNELQAERDALQAQVDSYRARIEALENEINAPFDDDYVIRIAREKLNLSLPYSIIFYNDLIIFENLKSSKYLFYIGDIEFIIIFMKIY